MQSLEAQTFNGDDMLAFLRLKVKYLNHFNYLKVMHCCKLFQIKLLKLNQKTENLEIPFKT